MQIHLNAQVIDPNGYNKFYYENGSLASEGNFKDGKPNGEWISYFEDGTVKSKGTKKEGLSYGIWQFYNNKGFKEWKYEYSNDVKNGCAQRYDSLGNVIEEFYYVNGVIQGEKIWYYSNGKIKQTVEFKDGKESGDLLTFNEQGDIITLEVYDNGFLKNQSTFNRFDENGEKTGLWREYYPNGQLKSEKNYRDGKLDGISKEFNEKGKLTELEKLNYGKVDTATGITLLEMYKEFHTNGKKKLVGGMQNGLKQGIYREYDTEGNLINGYIYEQDTVVAKGFISPEGIYNGEWELYYKSGQIKAKGTYENGQKNGDWIYFYPSGKIEQKGKLKENNYVGNWTWYYPNGQLQRTEFFNNKSLLEGTVTEFDSLGNEITRGDYYNGKREGQWFYHVNDYKEEGEYTIGLQNGIWKGYYKNGKLYWIGEFSEGSPKGKHIYYHPNGKRKTEGKYVGGLKHGEWKQYNTNGEEIESIIYKQGEIYKINGFKVIPVEEE